MSTTRLTDTRLVVGSIVLSGGIFAADLVLASLWSPRRRDTYLAAGAGTTLTALGYGVFRPRSG